MGFKAIRETWNRNRREMGDQDAIRENQPKNEFLEGQTRP